MNNLISKIDMLWTFASKFLQVASGIIILPLLFSLLIESEIAVWYVYLSFGTMISLFDFGMQPTVLRNAAFIYSGANVIVKEGTSSDHGTFVNKKLLADFVKTTKTIYSAMAVLAFFTVGIFGYLYLTEVMGTTLNSSVIESWVVFSLASCLELRYSYISSLLIGNGKISNVNKAGIIGKLMYIVIAVVLLFGGFGLVGISIANLIGVCVTSIMLRIGFFDTNHRQLEDSVSGNFNVGILKTMWYNSRKMGVITLSYFLMTKANTLIIGKYLNLDSVTSYGFTTQLFDVVVTLSTIVHTVSQPKINVAALKNKMKEFKKYCAISLYSALTLCAIGSLLIVFIASDFLTIIKMNVSLLSDDQMMLLMMTQMLGVNYSLFCQFISAGNQIPYEKASILSGFMCFVLTLLLLEFKQGIYGVLLAPLLVNGLYNYWKWPMQFMKTYSSSYKELLNSVTISLKGREADL